MPAWGRMSCFSAVRRGSHFLVKLGMGGNIFPGLPNSPQSFPQAWDPTCVVSLSLLTGRGIMGQRVLQYLCSVLSQRHCCKKSQSCWDLLLL